MDGLSPFHPPKRFVQKHKKQLIAAGLADGEAAAIKKAHKHAIASVGKYLTTRK